MSVAPIERVCPAQVDPLDFFRLLTWIDGRPLLDVMEPYRQQTLHKALYTFRHDGSPLYRRVLNGRAKKNFKTTDSVLSTLYKCLIWKPAGAQLNQCYYVASDLGQADDDLDLTKLLIRRNPLLNAELVMKSNIVERRDGKGGDRHAAAMGRGKCQRDIGSQNDGDCRRRKEGRGGLHSAIPAPRHHGANELYGEVDGRQVRSLGADAER